jgi:hypothetical protein
MLMDHVYFVWFLSDSPFEPTDRMTKDLFPSDREDKCQLLEWPALGRHMPANHVTNPNSKPDQNWGYPILIVPIEDCITRNDVKLYRLHSCTSRYGN